MILSKISTKPPKGTNKSETKGKFREMSREIGDLQHKLYAEDKRSMLVVFQGMDASGKDGATRKVFRFCSPSGIDAHAFRKPSDEEFAHDFLWRVHKLTPAKGQIAIFNRSHYEDILIQRVHKWIDEDHVDKRIKAINAFEQLLIDDNETTILKFYMHISEERQKEKLQERIDRPEKNWKHNDRDWEERKHWKEYMRCYEEVLSRCNVVPWEIVPADSRWYRDFYVARKVLEVMRNMDIQLPVLPSEK